MQHTYFANQCQVKSVSVINFLGFFYSFLFFKIVMNCCFKNYAEKAKYKAKKLSVF